MNYSFRLLLLLLLSGIVIVKGQTVKTNGQLYVEDTKLVNQYGEACSFRGMSYGWHNWWPRFYNEESVMWLKEDWNCNIVRAAMGVQNKEGEQLKKGYLKKPEWSVSKIKKIIDGAIKEDIYVIIDWHSHTIQLEAAKEFFRAMAIEYGQHPNIIYEIFNEPVEQSWEEVKKYSVEVIKTIREIDPDNIILVGTPHWCQDVHLAADDPISGYKNIMYTLHFYAATHQEEIRERGQYALDNGLPLFVSECAAMKANGDGELDLEEWQQWIDWMETNNISWVNWAIADKNETCSVLNKSASSKGNWSEKDIKESGIMVRHLIQKLNPQ